ncbi:hypothetical protein PGB90_000961 [Kerria lacca]
MSIFVPDSETNLIFSDEATFHVSGHVNRHNCIISDMEKPTEIQEHVRDSPKVNMWWCAATPDGIVGPYFHTGNENRVKYLEMLDEFFLPNLSLRLCHMGFFQKDGAPCHYANIVTAFLNKHFPGQWIG